MSTNPVDRLRRYREARRAGDLDAILSAVNLAAGTLRSQDLDRGLAAFRAAYAKLPDDAAPEAIAQAEADAWENLTWDRAAQTALLEVKADQPVTAFTGETWSTEADPEPRAWLVPGLLPAGRLASLYGTGAAGKSMLALQLAAGLMHNHAPLCPDRDEDDADALIADSALLQPAAADGPQRVLWLSWEDEAPEMVRRWRMLHRAGAIRSAYPDPARFTFVDMRKFGGQALWAPDHGKHVSTTAGWTMAGHMFLRSMPGHALAVLDPLAAAYASSEIDRALVRAFTSAIDGAAEEHGCAVLLVAHLSQSGGGKDGGGFSGSTDWQASVRSHMVLETSDDSGQFFDEGDSGGKAKYTRASGYRLMNLKQSYAVPADPLWLIRRWAAATEDRGASLAWFGARAATAAKQFEQDAASKAKRSVRDITPVTATRPPQEEKGPLK